VYDLIVIGAGLSGLMAAYTAARAGLKVKVIAKGLGALHWSAGTVDVLGYYPDGHTPIERPLEAVRRLAEAEPGHPYALLGADGLAEALQTFVALTEELGLPYAGSADGRNLWLPSPAGAARPAFLAPQAQWAGRLDGPPQGAPLLIVGLEGMRDLYPQMVAANLTKLGYPARAATLPLDLVTSRRDSNTAQLAAAFDAPEVRARLASQLKRLVQPGERVGLPAILGLKDHQSALAQLQAEVGAPVFEVPTLPPSVPGMRLYSALRRRLQRLGVRLEINLEIIAIHAEAGRLLWFETETSGRPLRHEARGYLLATGGVLGGGIATDYLGNARETALGLPLATPADRATWFRPRFFDPGGHPFFRAGVPVNRQFQPLDAAGAPVYENVWAAGGLLAHADPIRERSVEGIAIATGMAAARHAAQVLRTVPG